MLGRRPLRCFQIRQFLPFACKFKALDLWLIAYFAVFIDRLVSFPVEHENVDRRDLALAWEFTARCVSFLSKDAASDAFVSSVNSKDAEG